jgi:pimeloyl-ACP methyl ester carboxylesterase
MLFNKITKEEENLFVNLEHIKEILKEDGTSDQLFILIHGWKHSAEDLIPVGRTILEDSQFQKATVVIPELRIQKFFSTSNIYTLVRDIVFLIDNLNNKDTEKFKHIYFIGHSAGALIARKVYLCAYGEIPNEKDPEKTPKAPFENIINTGKDKTIKNKQSTYVSLKLGTQKDWVKKVNRIILLAGINMGWTASPAFRWLNLFGADAGIFLDTFFNRVTQKFFIFQIRRGSSFITNLRIQWLTMSQSLEAENKKEKEVLVIQLLGNQDKIVSPQDNIDYVTGKNFYYKDVPKTNQKNIIKLNIAKINLTKRYLFFKEALTYDPKNDKAKLFISIEDLYDRGFIPSNRDIKNVVFVIHGIRDEGFWTNRIARKIKQLANNSEEKATWASETSSYGYFGMLPFLFPYLRVQKVEWLMDKYIENRSLYPEANFHYVGHSNGTYLVAEALDKYSFCKFKHIVFAGSVVDSKYEWGKRIGKKQVKQFLNFVATSDWIVAIFPNFFEGYPWNNLGGAGHKGFRFNIDKPSDKHEDTKSYYETNSEETIHQLRYIKGGHGAAIQENNWELIANFIIDGKKALNEEALREIKIQNKQNLFIAILGFFRYFIWLIILIFIFITGVLFIAYSAQILANIITWSGIPLLFLTLITLARMTSFIPDIFNLLSISQGIMLIVYLSILWNIITRI